MKKNAPNMRQIAAAEHEMEKKVCEASTEYRKKHPRPSWQTVAEWEKAHPSPHQQFDNAEAKHLEGIRERKNAILFKAKMGAISDEELIKMVGELK